MPNWVKNLAKDLIMTWDDIFLMGIASWSLVDAHITVTRFWFWHQTNTINYYSAKRFFFESCTGLNTAGFTFWFGSPTIWHTWYVCTNSATLPLSFGQQKYRMILSWCLFTPRWPLTGNACALGIEMKDEKCPRLEYTGFRTRDQVVWSRVFSTTRTVLSLCCFVTFI